MPADEEATSRPSTAAPAPRRKSKGHSALKTLRDIQRHQREMEFMNGPFQRKPDFRKLVGEIAKDYKTDLRFLAKQAREKRV